MSFDEALSYLLSLGHETLTIKLGLRNTEKLLSALGNPHKHFTAVQIAGTNGKGSTAVTLDSICRAAGVRVGLFTSPHLVSITERIQIDGEPISDSDFARLTEQVRRIAEQLIKQGELETLPTFFEHVTAIALLAFRETKVELAILETGLGGRLDSTTAAGAKIVAITPIAMDHEEYLGHTLAEIAAEKAAIIRPGVTAIIAPQSKEAFDVIRRQCESAGVEPRIILESVEPISSSSNATSADGRFCISLRTNHETTERVLLGLRGRHQVANVSTAIALTDALVEYGFEIPRQAIIRGVKTAKHPGRLEVWEGQPAILFDGAHNLAAARALRDYLDEFVNQPITMIFGAMRDKSLAKMAVTLFPAAAKVILTEMENPRAASAETLSQAAPEGFDPNRILHAASPRDALRMATEITPAGGTVCVTGSLYLIGAVQQAVKESIGIAHGPD